MAALLVAISTAGAAAQCEQAKAMPDEISAGDQFGTSTSIFGQWALIGSPLDDEGGSNAGAAYMYRFQESDWIEHQKLAASDEIQRAYFGESVSLSDGVAIVGARLHDGVGERSGAAYVYRFDGVGWVEEQKLTPSDLAESDQFGNAVSIDGDLAIVGSWHDDDGAIEAGSAYVFRFDGQTWVEEAKLTAPDTAFRRLFGESVAISGDVAAAGAIHDDDNGDKSGAVYVFRFDGVGWPAEEKLTASDAAADDHFGWSLAAEGNVIVVGSPHDADFGEKTGAAYAFRFDGDTWVEEEKLTASDGGPDKQFGSSVSLDGDQFAVGAFHHDDPTITFGPAYVYHWDGSNWGDEIRLSASDGAIGDSFGCSIAIHDGIALIGAIGDDDAGIDAGSAYFFMTDSCGDAHIQDAKSLLFHGADPGTELAIDLDDSAGVEPRLGGPRKLTFEMSEALDAATVAPANVQIDCAVQTHPAIARVTLEDTDIVVIELANGLADEDCCMFSFNGMATETGGIVLEAFDVVTLQGDLDFNGGVTGGDLSLIKPHFNEVIGVDLDAPQWDFDRNGGVSGGDFALIKPLLGNIGAACP